MFVSTVVPFYSNLAAEWVKKKKEKIEIARII